MFRSTLGSVFKVLSKTVVESARAASTEPESLTQRDVNNKYESTIQAWTMVVDALKKMTNIAKFHETKPLFACLVKVSWIWPEITKNAGVLAKIQI